MRVFTSKQEQFLPLEKNKTDWAIWKKSCHICIDLKYIIGAVVDYGNPRIAREIEAKRMRASHPFVAKLMRERDLINIVKKKFKKTTNSSHWYPVVENYFNQSFQVKNSKEAWVFDITYIRTSQYWLYLTYCHLFVWQKSYRLDIEWDDKSPGYKYYSLENSKTRPLQDHYNLIFHSDRGIQYTCSEFTSIVGKNITQSMSVKGKCLSK